MARTLINGVVIVRYLADSKFKDSGHWRTTDLGISPLAESRSIEWLHDWREPCCGRAFACTALLVGSNSLSLAGNLTTTLVEIKKHQKWRQIAVEASSSSGAGAVAACLNQVFSKPSPSR